MFKKRRHQRRGESGDLPGSRKLEAKPTRREREREREGKAPWSQLRRSPRRARPSGESRERRRIREGAETEGGRGKDLVRSRCLRAVALRSLRPLAPPCPARLGEPRVPALLRRSLLETAPLTSSPVSPENENRDDSRKVEVRISNIEAAKALSDAVRTSLGPRGMDKMVKQADGEVIITNDGATILDKVKVRPRFFPDRARKGDPAPPTSSPNL